MPAAAGLTDNPLFPARRGARSTAYPAMNEARPIKIKYEVHPEDGLYVARCLNIDIVSDGETEEEALDNLREAIELYFERNAEAAISQPNAED